MGFNSELKVLSRAASDIPLRLVRKIVLSKSYDAALKPVEYSALFFKTEFRGKI
jgi:hypothetical protein